MAANQGVAVPEGWLIDREGRPTTEPAGFFETPRAASLLPLGGAADGHKGFLLSLIVEAFAGALAGAGMSRGNENEDQGNGLFVLAADPQALGSGCGVRADDGGVHRGSGGLAARRRAARACASPVRAPVGGPAAPTPSTAPPGRGSGRSWTHSRSATTTT